MIFKKGPAAYTHVSICHLHLSLSMFLWVLLWGEIISNWSQLVDKIFFWILELRIISSVCLSLLQRQFNMLHEESKETKSFWHLFSYPIPQNFIDVCTYASEKCLCLNCRYRHSWKCFPYCGLPSWLVVPPVFGCGKSKAASGFYI